jgi:hypothetical protein
VGDHISRTLRALENVDLEIASRFISRVILLVLEQKTVEGRHGGAFAARLYGFDLQLVDAVRPGESGEVGRLVGCSGEGDGEGQDKGLARNEGKSHGQLGGVSDH